MSRVDDPENKTMRTSLEDSGHVSGLFFEPQKRGHTVLESPEYSTPDGDYNGGSRYKPAVDGLQILWLNPRVGLLHHHFLILARSSTLSVTSRAHERRC